MNPNVRPVHYNIHLYPDLTTFKFKGTEEVLLRVVEPARAIEFNGLEMKVLSAAVTVGGAVWPVKGVSENAEKEAFVVELEKEVPVGEAVLKLEFEGEINDKLAGFYRSRYEYNGQSYYLGTTQFEPCDARRAFPCWDEPACKARFSITMTVQKDLTALSNMPIKSETTEGDLKTCVFDVTPVMSTYLVAYCVGHFEYLETTTEEGIKFRVYTVPGKKELGRFALDVGAKTISFFAKYYGIEYPLPKQDMIAVPDFSFGAMENWGLITYRETALLCDESSSFVAKSRVAYVVGHELAHQWFGNLVTMEWWKELWLNEGFATFMGTKAVDHLFPQWQVWTKFLNDHVFRALRVDALRSSHPIEVDISVARKVDEIFDAISYAKGASVILMIESALGEEPFRKGLNIYLNRFKYGNAHTEDLWQGLTEGSGKKVSNIMDPWVKKIGYPVVTVEETGQPGKLKITQNRYLAAGDVKPEENETIWPILLGVSTQSHPDIKYVELNTKEAVIDVDVSSNTEWIKLNAGQTGLYRVQYSAALFKRLGDNLSALSARDRAGLQNDAFALAIAGSISVVDYLELVSKFTEETNDTVWSDIFANLAVVRKLFDSPSMEKFVLKLVSKIGGELGWSGKPGEDESRSSLRGSVIATLGAVGDVAVIEEAKKRWTAFLSDKNSLPADLQSGVFYLVAKNGGEAEINQMIEVYKTSTLPAQKVTALRSIGSSRNPELIKKGLEYMMSEEVRMQDRFILLAALASSKVGRDICWDYVKQNWSLLEVKISHNLLPRIISYTCEDFSTPEKAKEVEDFFSQHKVHGTERTIAQTIESINSNTAIHSRNVAQVSKYLEQFN
uniref:Aminopeptidase n=1 Tax=Arcella intermedia TaxID=1963864 RepID=A0A6B2KY43_9EUKA